MKKPISPIPSDEPFEEIYPSDSIELRVAKRKKKIDHMQKYNLPRVSTTSDFTTVIKNQSEDIGVLLQKRARTDKKEIFKILDDKRTSLKGADISIASLTTFLQNALTRRLDLKPLRERRCRELVAEWKETRGIGLGPSRAKPKTRH